MDHPLERPVVAVDVVMLTVSKSELRVLLHRRTSPPFSGELSLPGVAVEAQEVLVEAARRALSVKAGFDPATAGRAHLEQLATFDALFRDPRGRTVGVAYLGLTHRPPDTGPDAAWCSVAALDRGSLPFDHDEILATAVTRLQGKLRYSDLARHLMPRAFKVDQLRELYERILGRTLNRSNFRTKLLKIGMLELAGEAEPGRQGGRPAHLYRFAREKPLDERDFL